MTRREQDEYDLLVRYGLLTAGSCMYLPTSSYFFRSTVAPLERSARSMGRERETKCTTSVLVHFYKPNVRHQFWLYKGTGFLLQPNVRPQFWWYKGHEPTLCYSLCFCFVFLLFVIPKEQSPTPGNCNVLLYSKQYETVLYLEHIMVSLRLRLIHLLCTGKEHRR